MSFFQALLVVVCVLVTLFNAIGFVTFISIPITHQNFMAVRTVFFYSFVPAILSVSYLLHLITTLGVK